MRGGAHDRAELRFEHVGMREEEGDPAQIFFGRTRLRYREPRERLVAPGIEEARRHRTTRGARDREERRQVLGLARRRRSARERELGAQKADPLRARWNALVDRADVHEQLDVHADRRLGRARLCLFTREPQRRAPRASRDEHRLARRDPHPRRRLGGVDDHHVVIADRRRHVRGHERERQIAPAREDRGVRRVRPGRAARTRSGCIVDARDDPADVRWKERDERRGERVGDQDHLAELRRRGRARERGVLTSAERGEQTRARVEDEVRRRGVRRDAHRFLCGRALLDGAHDRLLEIEQDGQLGLEELRLFRRQ